MIQKPKKNLYYFKIDKLNCFVVENNFLLHILVPELFSETVTIKYCLFKQFLWFSIDLSLQCIDIRYCTCVHNPWNNTTRKIQLQSIGGIICVINACIPQGFLEHPVYCLNQKFVEINSTTWVHVWILFESTSMPSSLQKSLQPGLLNVISKDYSNIQ